MVTLRFFIGVCGNVAALLLYLAPLATFRRIIKNKSTEQFSCVPYAMSVLSCLLYTWYSLPFVTPNNLLLTTISGTGATIESVYVLIFIIYASKKQKAWVLGLVTFVISVITTVALVSLFAVHGKFRKLLCGLFASIVCIVMYGSPLSVMEIPARTSLHTRLSRTWDLLVFVFKMVIKTKSVEYMPFCLSLFVFLCGTSWFVYGLLGTDPFVFVPNGLGSILGMMQLILYAIYRNRKAESDKALHDGSLFPVDPKSENALQDGSRIEIEPEKANQKHQEPA